MCISFSLPVIRLIIRLFLQRYKNISYFRVCIMIKQKVPKPGRGSEEQDRELSSWSRFVIKTTKNVESTS